MDKVMNDSELAESLKKESGMYAFPFTAGSVMCPGMSLRDYFAAKAIAGMLSSHQFTDAAAFVGEFEGKSTAEKVAELAYQTADAMLVERAK